jgi:hypothetical protein
MVGSSIEAIVDKVANRLSILFEIENDCTNDVRAQHTFYAAF